MRTGDVSDLPNPFAPDPPAEFTSTDSARSNWQALISSLKLLSLLVVGFVAFSFLTQRGPDWLAARLTSDFQSQDATTKKARLKQLSELGDSGISGLVLGLADDDLEIAEHSRQFIRDLQISWASMPTDSATQSRQALSQSLQAIDARLSNERQVWVRELIQHTQRAVSKAVPKVVASEQEGLPEPSVAQAGYVSGEQWADESFSKSVEPQLQVPRPRARVIKVRFNEDATDENRVKQPANELQPFSREQPMLLRSVRQL